MLPKQTLEWGSSRSAIRDLSEYSAKRKAEIGAENVFDFSLGNPSVQAPPIVNETIADLIKGDSVSLHGYTTAAGLLPVREKLCLDLNKRFGLNTEPEYMYITCGAAAGLCISLRAVLMPGDEVITIAPFFPEYRVFVEASGGKLVSALPREDFQIDIENFKAALNERTRAVILNSPNNPSGAVYSGGSLRKLADTLRERESKTGQTIYLISDEPYREIVYDGIKAETPLKYYDDSIMCYSFSKSLSLPGERIGYVVLNDRLKDKNDVYAGITGAARALGYVNPPSLFQRVIEKCCGNTADVSEYARNRELLCEGLKDIGYKFQKPDGAFYLFMKALEPDAGKFSLRARDYELMLVPSDSFGIPGYVRISYCVSESTIRRSMPAFEALYKSYAV